MKKTRYFTVALASIFCFVSLLSGCSNTQGPVQTKDFTLADVNAINVDYDGESVTIKKSDTDKIKIVEYMDKGKKSYFAKMNLAGGILVITEGSRPIGNGVHSYIEVYLPESYQNDLSLHTTDGRISSDLTLKLNDVRVDTTSGTIELSALSAEQINLTSTGGKVLLKNLIAQFCTVNTTNADTSMDNITGTIAYQSKGGNLTVTSASGSGNFQAVGDGDMKIMFCEVLGDLTAYAKNGNLALTIPAGLNFIFSATTKDGSIQTPFSDQLSSTENTVGGTIGNNTDIKIDLETKNGDISVNVL